MKLNKSTQYGMLFTMYIARAGRCTVQQASDSLSLSYGFLEQVAKKLRLSGVITSVRGRHGGYELCGEPKVYHIFEALQPVKLLANEESNALIRGTAEQRAFVFWTSKLTLSLVGVMNHSIRDLNQHLVKKEMAALEQAVETAGIN